MMGMSYGVNGGGVWLMWAMLLSIMGLQHPPVQNERLPLSRGEKLHGAFALVLLILTFVPVPIQFGEDMMPPPRHERSAPPPELQQEEPQQDQDQDQEPEEEAPVEEYRL